MELQCECGKFRAELKNFPNATPGRIVCYCDDCRAYLHFLKRADLLNANGGTELVPAYPSDIKITQGQEQLKCVRLSTKGMYRFFTGCCNTPFANTDPKRAWAGIPRRMYTTRDPNKLDQALGPVRAGILGKFAHGTPPEGTAQTFDFKAFKTIFPFVIKGIFQGRSRPSPFFNGEAPAVTPHVMTKEEFADAHAAAT